MTKFEIRINVQITNVQNSKRGRAAASSFGHLSFEFDSKIEFRHSNLRQDFLYTPATLIASLTGTVRHVHDDRIHLAVGPILFELLTPAADHGELISQVGEEMTFHTVFYFQGDAGGGGNIEPRLIGFLRINDKRFFEKFITVKGIGPRKALKAISKPVGEIAHAIESRDTRFLVGLPEIGKRTAELLVAELAGKVGGFAEASIGTSRSSAARRPGAEEDAIASLIALGERRVDAERLLDRARAANPSLVTTDALVREMLRLRTAPS
jgi:holliday junction DNA helicase RuvA